MTDELLTSAFRSLLPWVVTLVFAALRLAPAVILLPVFGGRALPTQSRVAILLVLAVGVSPGVSVGAAVELSPIALAWNAIREVSLGLPIAIVIATPFFALEHAGHLLDAARGANVSEVIAPDSGARSSPLAEILRGAFGVVFLAAGGLRATLSVVAASFDAWPVAPASHARALPLSFLDAAARWTSHSLAATVTVVAAALIALLASEFVLAIATRLSPPLAQSGVAVPLRALAPLAVLAATVGLWTGAANELAHNALSAARLLVR